MLWFASLADLKTQLNITSAANDSELQLMLDAATDVVASFVGTFDAVAVTETVAAHGGTVLLTGTPTGDVTVSDFYGTAVTGFTVNRAARLLQYVPAACGPLTVSYSTGTGIIPAAVKLATVIIAGHLWETQRGSSPSALALQGDADAPFSGGAGFAIPSRAKELLEPFVRSGQIA